MGLPPGISSLSTHIGSYERGEESAARVSWEWLVKLVGICEGAVGWSGLGLSFGTGSAAHEGATVAGVGDTGC